MIKVLSWIFIIALIVFSIFGFLVLFEYLKFWKRKISLRLKYRLSDLQYSDDFEDISSSSEVLNND